ncbi:DUF2878 domain-containing protein [Amphritea japonica]|uniref:DUF2878 domain-containing protein n=1 Tax=Amphritea japonica ATCC BAA-1530 TaxID=1278309 RepID=A0A7R6PHT7_9GAMM|nr:DUF2878 domain-containing protein [Amphritea japonica]BBB26787.1 conserved hypothetical protein [Amphritea japonica ATCC BAA-1530]
MNYFIRSGYSQHFWFNLGAFQLCWWCAILLTDSSLVILAVLLILHLLLHSHPVHETAVVLSCGLTGFAVDVLLTATGIFHFGISAFPPLWLLFLWFCFSATLRQSMRFFHGRWALATICGGVSGGLTYVAAANFGAVGFGFPFFQAFLLLVLVWMVLFPLLLWLSDQRFTEQFSDAT